MIWIKTTVLQETFSMLIYLFEGKITERDKYIPLPTELFPNGHNGQSQVRSTEGALVLCSTTSLRVVEAQELGSSPADFSGILVGS